MSATPDFPARGPWGDPALGTCWCDKASRGLVAEHDGVPAHICHGCSVEHCEDAVYARRCEFGICTRDAELEVLVDPSHTEVEAVRVCGLHVSPLLGWGLADPLEATIIRYLGTEPGRAA